MRATLVFAVCALLAVSVASQSRAPTDDARVWPDRWQSSWFFVRVDPRFPLNNTNSPLTSYGRFYYDWTNTRARFTHNRCPVFLPSETDFINVPCDTVFLGSNIYLVSYNVSQNERPSCCKWDNPWNATVTSPDWIARGHATSQGTTTRTGWLATYYRGELPFVWEAGVRPADSLPTGGKGASPSFLPHFLDLYDTPDTEPNTVTRWATPDVELVDKFDDRVFALPAGVDCSKACDMPTPFPVPAPDEIRYPHVAGVIPPSTPQQQSQQKQQAQASRQLPPGHPRVRAAKALCPFGQSGAVRVPAPQAGDQDRRAGGRADLVF